jgi:hypothetical protein
MEIQYIRRLRLAQLIQEKYEGSQAKFVDETGENQGEVSGLLRAKSFGERKARKLEEKCGLPRGWLDIDPITEKTTRVTAAVPPAPRPALSVVENIEPQWMALVYVTQRELDLLTHYRCSSDMGKSLVETAAESAAGDRPGSGSVYQS